MRLREEKHPAECLIGEDPCEYGVNYGGEQINLLCIDDSKENREGGLEESFSIPSLSRDVLTS